MSIAAEGTQVAVIGTEHTLYTINAAGDYQFIVDRTNQATGDTLELRVKLKAITGGALVPGLYQPYDGAPATNDKLELSIPFGVEVQGVVTLKQTAGTGRSFPWMVRLIEG